jgi:hypothetical protein
MNEASLFPNHALIRAILVFTICTLLGSMSLQSVEADAAPPPEPTVGGVSPYQPQKTNVQMMSETVLIDVPSSPSNSEEPKQIKVNASFTMRNQGQIEEQMQVIFPLSRLGHDGSSEQALYRVDESSFSVKVNGQSVSTTEITTPPEASGYEVPDVLWAAFEVKFPVHQDVLLQVEYEMLNEYGMYGEGFTGIAYILETGAGWYGKILSADITLRLPFPVTEEAIWGAKSGYIITGNEMHWKLENFEPTREDNLGVSVIHVDVWQTILDLRARVEQYPADADAWAILADWYQQFSIFFSYGDADLPYYSINHHFADLTLEARQNVVALRPEWGNAHFRLAQILWFINPTVEERFGSSVKKIEYFQPDDPSIQEVIHELDLAWSYGFDGNVDSRDVEQFQRRINNVVPGLELTSLATATATMHPPTETIAPTATITASPTVLPTLISIASPTPLPTETSFSIPYGILIAITFSLVIIIGIFAYQVKSKGK